jgi:hypothetical protein
MLEHNWEVEEIDGGALGVGTFLKCNRCGASGVLTSGRKRLHLDFTLSSLASISD